MCSSAMVDIRWELRELIAVEKLRLMQNIYIILTLAESEEVIKKNPFSSRKCEKSSKGRACEGNHIHAVILLAYVMMSKTQL